MAYFTTPERSGIRDTRYNDWHRTIDPRLKFSDIDGIEWDAKTNEPVLMLELKHWKAKQEITINDIRARNLATRASIPFLKLHYFPIGNDAHTGEPEPQEEWYFQFSGFGCNDLGFKMYQDYQLWNKMNAKEYELFLLKIRGLA